MELNNDVNPNFGKDAFEREVVFITWLKYHDLNYVVEDRITGGYYIRILFPDGWYMRISDFENPMYWYVRDMGEVGYLDIFSLTDRILKQKERSLSPACKPDPAKQKLMNAFLSGDPLKIREAMVENKEEENN